MNFHLLLRAAIACAAVTGVSLSAAAQENDFRTGEILLAQAAGYDPMRPAMPLPGASPRPEGNPEFDGLIDGPGAEDTFYMCSACHSIALVKQQRLSDARWDYLWTWMIEDQGMADPGEELRETILDYLKEHYSSER
ncbi:MULTISPECIES: cytochrome C-552 [Aquamicrobium]|uniref:Uncharacterized protein n=2 Tax=Aquamicrobium TaxID=69278 RepID=A0A4R6YEZ5_9HYPH|nr:cytochrome C-552 [Aquamicrobium defluvii]TDR34820.1 hypothetical protein DES43_11232 [Aquamicrobium defluvii]